MALPKRPSRPDRLQVDIRGRFFPEIEIAGETFSPFHCTRRNLASAKCANTERF